MSKKQELTENLVVKSNELITASYAMTVNEQRLLLACISQIDSRQKLEGDAVFTLTVEQARDLFYSRGDQRHAYRDLQVAAERLFERKVRIDLGGNEELLTRFVQTVRFSHDVHKVELRFATGILPYLSQLEQNFTQYRMSNIVHSPVPTPSAFTSCWYPGRVRACCSRSWKSMSSGICWRWTENIKRLAS